MTMPETFSLQGRIFVVRLLCCLSTLALLVANDVFCRAQPGAHLWLLAAGVLYPLIGHALFGRIDIDRRSGHVLFLADGMFAGAVIAALGFAPLPAVVLLVISLFNWMVVGGVMLVALGMLFMLTGMLVMGANPFVLALAPDAGCALSNGLASLIAVAYFLVVARIIYRLVGALRFRQVEFRARTDAASTARAMAEQALLAVLPTSAAQKMAAAGKFAPEPIGAATVLLLDFRTLDQGFPGLAVMQDALQICTRILARHDVELVKSWGALALAVSRSPSGPDDARAAFMELDGFFKDHGHAVTSLRGILHLGPVTLGLVQPERLNLDLFGPPLDDLTRLAAAPELQNERLVVTAPACLRLSDPASCGPLPTAGALPVCYRCPA